MDEKSKMLAGLPYDAWDKQLLQERMRAKQLCHRFNQLQPEQHKVRSKIISELINTKGSVLIEPNFWVDYGYNIFVGKRFYSNHNLTILDCCEVKIGDNVMCAPNVLISTATHPIDPIERQTTEYGAPITIGDNVWIGGNAAIMPGVTIGSGTTIGAGSIVTKDIPSNCVAVGSPCRAIKHL